MFDQLFLYCLDLQLAAELGKALLERNRDLEAQLYQAQQIIEEQQLEIDVTSPYITLICVVEYTA